MILFVVCHVMSVMLSCCRDSVTRVWREHSAAISCLAFASLYRMVSHRKISGQSLASHRPDTGQSPACHRPVIGQSLASHWSVIDQSSTNHWPVTGQSLASHRPVTGQSQTSRCCLCWVTACVCYAAMLGHRLYHPLWFGAGRILPVFRAANYTCKKINTQEYTW